MKDSQNVRIRQVFEAIHSNGANTDCAHMMCEALCFTAFISSTCHDISVKCQGVDCLLTTQGEDTQFTAFLTIMKMAKTEIIMVEITS